MNMTKIVLVALLSGCADNNPEPPKQEDKTTIHTIDLCKLSETKGWWVNQDLVHNTCWISRWAGGMQGYAFSVDCKELVKCQSK